MMLQRWRSVAFLHWPYPRDAVQAMLPPGLAVQTFEGNAWIGLIPFLMDDVRLPRSPAVPWLSRFPETNVRTYVVGPDGASGIYFLSMDAARLPLVIGARASLGLPYIWSAMSVDVGGRKISYRGLRRSNKKVSYYTTIQVGPAYTESDLGPLDIFLTARYRLYSHRLGRCWAINVHHPPWQLCHADLGELHQDLITAVGLPEPASSPLVHAALGVDARIGMPTVIRDALSDRRW
jgi:uncharacterized protein YqjF (DUF2071 family)